jgi:hypothetical protein
MVRLAPVPAVDLLPLCDSVRDAVRLVPPAGRRPSRLATTPNLMPRRYSETPRPGISLLQTGVLMGSDLVTGSSILWTGLYRPLSLVAIAYTRTRPVACGVWPVACGMWYNVPSHPSRVHAMCPRQVHRQMHDIGSDRHHTQNIAGVGATNTVETIAGALINGSGGRSPTTYVRTLQ